MKQYKIFFLTFLAIFSLFNTTFSKQARIEKDPTPMGGPLPDFNNPEFKEMMEAEMKAFEALPPEQQQKMLEAEFEQMMQDPEFKKTFDKIEEFSQTDEGKDLFEKIERDGDISEDEFAKLLEHMEKAAEPKPVDSQVESPIIIPKTEPRLVTSDKDLQAATILADLISHTTSFITKSGLVVDLPAKIKPWTKKYPSFTWQANLTWNAFHDDLEKLVRQFQTLLDKDPKNNSYRHIKNLVADQGLLNNISKVHKIIIDVEPKIEDVVLDKKLSKTSKENLRKTITQYIEALYTLNLSQDIANLIASFDETAKKLTESEEKAKKQADIESKKIRQPGRSITAGKSRAAEYNPYDYEYDAYDAYPPSYNSPAYSNPAAYNPPSSTSPKPSAAGSSQQQKPTEKPSAPSGAAEASTLNQTAPFSADKGYNEAKPSSGQSSIQNQTPQKPQGVLEITANIKALDKKIGEADQFKNLKIYLESDKPIDPTINENIEDIIDAFDNRNTGLVQLLEKLKNSNKNNTANQKTNKEKIDKALKEAKNIVKLQSDLTSFFDTTSPDNPKLTITISDEKLKAYFPGIFKVQNPKSPESEGLSETTSLIQLGDLIEAFEQEVKKLTIPPKK